MQQPGLLSSYGMMVSPMMAPQHLQVVDVDQRSQEALVKFLQKALGESYV